MTRLALISILVGSLTLALKLPGIFAPEKFRDIALKFPRHRRAGQVLIGIVALIVWWVMYHAATDEWKWAQPLIFVGVPIAFGLVVYFPPHYLALRAVAALLLLIAKQMVDAADWSATPWRLVVTVLAYVWVGAAIWMTVAPHHIRDALGYGMANNQRCRLACGVGALVGFLLIGLGVLVY